MALIVGDLVEAQRVVQLEGNGSGIVEREEMHFDRRSQSLGRRIDADIPRVILNVDSRLPLRIARMPARRPPSRRVPWPPADALLVDRQFS